MEKRPEGEGETVCEPEIENGETQTCVPETCIKDRNQDYKLVILNIAECLASDDVRKIVYIQDLPAEQLSLAGQPHSYRETTEQLYQASSLQVLQLMEKHGMMSDYNIRPLANVLKLINRHDLINNHIKPYLSKHGSSTDCGHLDCQQFRARANAVSFRKYPEHKDRRYSDSQSRPVRRQVRSPKDRKRPNSSPPVLPSEEILKYPSTTESPLSSLCTPKAWTTSCRPSLNPITENRSERELPTCNHQLQPPHIAETGRQCYPGTCCLLFNPANPLNGCLNPNDLEFRPQQEQDDQCTIIIILTHKERPDELDLSQTDTDSMTRVEDARDIKQQSCPPSKFQGQEILWLLQWKKCNEVVSESEIKTYLGAGAKKKPELVFKLYYSKNATLEIKLQMPAKCHLPSSANITLSVTLWECRAGYQRLKLSEFRAEESVRLRQYSNFKFTTCTTLRESQTDYIEINASAELTGLDPQP